MFITPKKYSSDNAHIEAHAAENANLNIFSSKKIAHLKFGFRFAELIVFIHISKNPAIKQMMYVVIVWLF